MADDEPGGAAAVPGPLPVPAEEYSVADCEPGRRREVPGLASGDLVDVVLAAKPTLVLGTLLQVTRRQSAESGFRVGPSWRIEHAGAGIAHRDIPRDRFTDFDPCAGLLLRVRREHPARQIDPASGLLGLHRMVLDFEARFYRLPAYKEQDIRDEFNVSPVVYYQLLNAVLELEEALAFRPVMVGHLRRVRENARRRCSGGGPAPLR